MHVAPATVPPTGMPPRSAAIDQRQATLPGQSGLVRACATYRDLRKEASTQASRQVESNDLLEPAEVAPPWPSRRSGRDTLVEGPLPPGLGATGQPNCTSHKQDVTRPNKIPSAPPPVRDAGAAVIGGLPLGRRRRELVRDGSPKPPTMPLIERQHGAEPPPWSLFLRSAGNQKRARSKPGGWSPPACCETHLANKATLRCPIPRVSQPRISAPNPPANREPCKHRKVENVAIKAESQSSTTGLPVWFSSLRQRLRCHSQRENYAPKDVVTIPWR